MSYLESFCFGNRNCLSDFQKGFNVSEIMKILKMSLFDCLIFNQIKRAVSSKGEKKANYIVIFIKKFFYSTNSISMKHEYNQIKNGELSPVY